MRAVRAGQSARLGTRAGQDLAAAGGGLLDAASHPRVAAYWPMGDEIDCRPLITHLANTGGFRLSLPVVLGPGRALIFRRWSPGDALQEGPFGTRHPLADAPEDDPDALLMPLLAVDMGGRRLGQGGGYYDRTVKALHADGRRPRLVGVCFEAQIVARVPAGPDDALLDWLLTEQRAARLGEGNTA